MVEQTVGDALRWGFAEISRSPSTTPRLDTELILGHVTGRTRTQLLAWPDRVLTADMQSQFARLVDARIAGAPVAHLTGSRGFMSLELRVGPGALVPRPETEHLVEWASTFLASAGPLEGRIVIDVGTGPGTILMALAANWPDKGVILAGSDVSPEALYWATINRSALMPSSRVHLVQGNLLDWFAGGALLIVANLPYLRPSQIDDNWELSHEPSLALDGGPEGLDMIEQLIHSLSAKLASDGAVALEVDPSQANAVAALIESEVPWLNAEIHHDLAGLARFVTGAARR